MAETGKITLKLFAAFREIAGQSSLEWPLPEQGTPAGEVLKALVSEYPGLEGPSRIARIMVNRQYATTETKLKPGDEVAFIPPVGGGA